MSHLGGFLLGALFPRLAGIVRAKKRGRVVKLKPDEIATFTELFSRSVALCKGMAEQERRLKQDANRAMEKLMAERDKMWASLTKKHALEGKSMYFVRDKGILQEIEAPGAKCLCPRCR